VIDGFRRVGRRLAVGVRRVLRVAKWESARASGGVDRRTLAAGVALLLVAGGVVGVGVATGVAGLDVDQDVYRVGVDAESPYAEAIEDAPSLRPVPAGSASLGDSADAVVVTVVRPGSGDDGAIDSPSDVGGSTDDGGDASGTDSDGGNTVSAADGDPTGEAARNTALSPTCERSALQVVQIQMNALRYNDNATNDGIRTLRAFASPENRQVVGPVGEYVELFETARYGPMLTYDTAEYSVPETADGTAAVEVVTREDGTVTGRYEFRLVRVGGGSATTNSSLGSVDDCWMTDAVTASGE